MKKVVCIPYIVALFLLFAIPFIHADSLELTWPERLSLSVQPGDSDSVTATVLEMRYAVAYYDMYLLARKAIFEYDALVQSAIEQEKKDAAALKEQALWPWVAGSEALVIITLITTLIIVH